MWTEGGLPVPEKLVVLIPCRLNSRRLPRKALLPIGNIPLIGLVYKNTLTSLKALKINSEIFVCTDSDEIIDFLKKSSIPFLKTSSNPTNGTERIAEALTNNKIDANYIIDVQGDEPFINSEILELVINELISKFNDPLNEKGIILPHQIINKKESQNISVVKLAVDKNSRVIYMSRSAIPLNHKNNFLSYGKISFKKHLSVIGFTKKALLIYNDSKISFLESIEDIELLRALENNIIIYSPRSQSKTFSIDTIDDLERARKIYM